MPQSEELTLLFWEIFIQGTQWGQTDIPHHITACITPPKVSSLIFETQCPVITDDWLSAYGPCWCVRARALCTLELYLIPRRGAFCRLSSSSSPHNMNSFYAAMELLMPTIYFRQLAAKAAAAPRKGKQHRLERRTPQQGDTWRHLGIDGWPLFIQTLSSVYWAYFFFLHFYKEPVPGGHGVSRQGRGQKCYFLLC